MAKIFFNSILILFIFSLTSLAQRGASGQLKEQAKEAEKQETQKQVSEGRNKKNVAAVSPSQEELDNFLFVYLSKLDSNTQRGYKDSLLDLIEDEARTAAMNSYFSKCSFNSLRAVAVINRVARAGEHSLIKNLSEKLVIPLSINYDGKIVPIWFYSVYKASLGIEDKMAYIARDSIKTKVFSEYFIGKMIKRMLQKERSLFKNIYAQYKQAKSHKNLSKALCSILETNRMYQDLAYALWVFEPLLENEAGIFAKRAIEEVNSLNIKEELEPLFKKFL